MRSNIFGSKVMLLIELQRPVAIQINLRQLRPFKKKYFFATPRNTGLVTPYCKLRNKQRAPSSRSFLVRANAATAYRLERKWPCSFQLFGIV